ncbi:carbohydrate ABC transporter permease [uncultured Subdoligranulum sp.]|uniref:carbohydrate ABC transporter permease n=1 Tax=uncultured Subdoligranulum sp. TaxID=512298 RepID=UPI0025D2B24C|nr:carbohydrate ABC transporter permease [uncultured Subdoligranulum sp.]
MSVSRYRMLAQIATYILFALITVFFLFPILWVLSTSFKTTQELFSVPPTLLPASLQFENYLHILFNTRIVISLRNSLILVAGAVAGALLIAYPAAYAFSRYHFRHKSMVMFLVLIFQMISPLIIVIPLYNYFIKLNLLNSMVSVICVYIAAALPFQTWFLKNFIDTIPVELDEAARIDGCNRALTILRVVFPVTLPGVFSSGLLTAISSWSQFIVPYILLDDPNKLPAAVALVNLQSTQDTITTHYLAAASIICILPTVLLFLFLQRYIVSALTAGAVKG